VRQHSAGSLTRRQQKHLISLGISLVVLGAVWYIQSHPKSQPGQVLSQTSPGSYRVTEFVDGDTIKVDMGDKQETIRMIGMDTPETHDPRKAVQCFGLAAAAYTKQLIGDKPVRLEADPLSTNRDRYNRLLRYVYTGDSKLVEAEDIQNGYAFAYTSFPFTKADEFRAYEKAAREAGKGLWSSCHPTPNQYGGFTSNDAP
jgi:endonuclease YncB( thermonuclease family)